MFDLPRVVLLQTTLVLFMIYILVSSLILLYVSYLCRDWSTYVSSLFVGYCFISITNTTPFDLAINLDQRQFAKNKHVYNLFLGKPIWCVVSIIVDSWWYESIFIRAQSSG
jgi:hypothetical protein